MARENIDQWADMRVRLPDGAWDKETLDVIFNCMCTRCPPLFNLRLWNPNHREEYMRLLELACEYIKWAGDVHGAFILNGYLRRDFKTHPREERKKIFNFTEGLLK
jgi:hypothetical protein